MTRRRPPEPNGPVPDGPDPNGPDPDETVERQRALLLGPLALELAPRCVDPPGSAAAWSAAGRAQGTLRIELHARAGVAEELAAAGLEARARPPLAGFEPPARLEVRAEPAMFESAREGSPVAELLAACARAVLEPPPAPVLMGVLNATPDSFSDGGLHLDPARARASAEGMCAHGVRWLDVGAESTRPGAAGVSEREELGRVLPLLDGFDGLPGLSAGSAAVSISIDTRRAAVARAALDRGAGMVNDVSAGRDDPALLELCAERAPFLCLMHMRGEPRTMQAAPRYDEVVGEVVEFLRARAAVALARGVPRERLVVDPGLGFGKTLEHNLELLARLGELRSLGLPVLLGASRKRFIGTLSGVEQAARRQAGSLAALTAAVLQGAAIVRVHDVQQSAEALGVAAALARGPLSAGDGR